MSFTKLLVILLCGLSCLVAKTSTVRTQMRAVIRSKKAVKKGELKLQLIFHGYPKIGIPQAGAALINEKGLTQIRDVTFTRIGGELSPNGRWIAYDNCSNSNRGIYLARPDGRNSKLILPLNGNSCADIRWSPDSAKLSYTSSHERFIRIYDIAKKTTVSIPNTDLADWHWWSPAGNEIVYGRTPPSSAGKPAGRLLHITDLRGKSRQLTFAKDFARCELVPDFIDTWDPAWSPNGRTISFTQCGRLFVVSPNGKGLRQLPASFAYSPRWSPDGRWIFFLDDQRVLQRISVSRNTTLAVGKLPYWGGPFSIAPISKKASSH